MRDYIRDNTKLQEGPLLLMEANLHHLKLLNYCNS